MSQPLKFSFMDTLPMVSEPYIVAALHYFPFKFRHANQQKIYRVCGGKLECGAMDGINTFYKSAGYKLEKMYGPPEELLEQVKLLMDFQGNTRYYDVEKSTYYYHKLRFYDGHESEKKYIGKNDLYLYIQNKLASKDSNLQNHLFLAMLAYFSKFKERALEGSCEFVEFEKEKFEDLEKKMDRMISDARALLPEPEKDWKRVFINFKMLLPAEIGVGDMNLVMQTIGGMFEGMTKCKKPETVAAFYYNYCEVLIGGIQKVIDENPAWFFPDAKLNAKLLPSKPIIRLFIDDHSSFALARELALALKIKKWTEDEEDIMDTVCLDSVKSICAAHKGEVSLVEIPIRRAKHRAVPIPSGTDTFCILAADVLLEQIREMLFEYHAFERANEHRRDELMKLLKDFEEVFNPEIPQIYMFTTKRVVDIECKVALRLTENFSGGEIGKVAPRGFTLGELKFSLEILSLDKFFKDITTHAKVAYENVMAKKKEQSLRTCDMQDAIENCVLISFFKKFPKLANFLHNQKSCHRIHGYQCSFCKKKDLVETLIPTFFNLSLSSTSQQPKTHDKKALDAIFNPKAQKAEWDKKLGKINKK